MSTKFLSPGWRMPRNANQSKSTNYSLDFDGNIQRVTVSNFSGLANKNSGSFSLWFKTTNTTTNAGKCIFSIPYSAGNNGFDLYINNSTSLKSYLKTTTFTTTTTNTITYGDGNWHHVAVVYDGSTHKIYFDTIDVTNTSAPTPSGAIAASTVNTLEIGRFSSSYANEFNGQIDGVAIFNYALSESQVTTLYGTGSAIGNPMALPSPPIAYYPLGTSAWNGQYLAENNAIGDYVFDFVGTSSQEISLTTSNLPSANSSFSMSVWLNRDSTVPSYAGVLSFGDLGSTNVLSMAYINFDTSNNIKYGFYNGDAGNTAISANNWHHVVLTYNGTNATFYINGQVVGIPTQPGTLAIPTTSTLKIGGLNTSAQTFNGKISNAQIFNAVLSGPEVETLYNYGSPIQTLANIPQNSNLKAWYKLDATEIYNSTSTEWSVDNNQNPSAYPSSLDFSGTDQYISCSSSSVFQNTSNFSVSFWVNMDDYSGGGCFLMSANAGSSIFHIYAYGGNNIQIRLRENNLGNGLISNVDLNNKWSNICLVYDGTKTGNSNRLKFYINKVEQTISFNSDIQSSINISSNFLIGQQSGQSGVYTIDGKLSNVSLFSNSLTDGTGGTLNQIETLYNNGTPLADMSSFSSLVSWWKLDNTTTGIQDSKGSNNGTNNGATEYAGFVNTLAGESSGMSQSNLVQSDLQTVAPYSKYAMSFDGNGYIDSGSVGNFTSSFTASCWVNNWPSSGQEGVLGNTNGQNRGWILLAPHATNSNAFKAYINTTAGWYSSENLNGFSDNTKWVNLVFIYDSINNTLMLYSNASEGVTATQPTGTLKTGADPLRIASEAGNNNFNGNISNVAIWNTALSASEVREIYNEGIPSNLHNFSGAAPVAWWQLGENSSFNGNDWICADEIGSNNGESNGMPVGALTNGVGTTANGTSTGMSEGSLIGDAPYSTANAISSGMPVTARGTDVPPTP
jgi:hypothetical protein